MFVTWLLFDVWYVTNIRNHGHINKKFHDCNIKAHTNRVSLCWGQLRPWLSSSEWIRRDLDREMRWLERMECLAPRWSHWKILEAASHRKWVEYPPVIKDGGEFDIYRWFSLIFINFPHENEHFFGISHGWWHQRVAPGHRTLWWLRCGELQLFEWYLGHMAGSRSLQQHDALRMCWWTLGSSLADRIGRN